MQAQQDMGAYTCSILLPFLVFVLDEEGIKQLESHIHENTLITYALSKLKQVSLAPDLWGLPVRFHHL